jgi:hypothetical protein
MPRKYKPVNSDYLLPKRHKKPEDDPLWPLFVKWVKGSKAVRKDLLENAEDEDWLLIWAAFAAGAEAISLLPPPPQSDPSPR